MKYLRVSFLLFGFAFLIVSCQKELSYEAGLGKGTLKKDATGGDCLPVSVNGNYIKDTLLKPTINFVDIQISVSEVGSYAIKTDTINGYSFNGAGFFTVQGLNTVRLIGYGKPLVSGFDMFTVKFDTSVCQFSVAVTSAGGGGNTSAVFTLVGSPTSCTGATQSNNFYTTVPTNSSNTVNIKVDVTTAGSYTITTPLVNGVSFSATGSLGVGTNQSITLLANGGTPTATGSFPYTLTTTTPASNCGFNLTVQAAPTPATYTFECPSNPTPFGTYQAGLSTSGDSVKINVTSIGGGSYNITTSTTTSSNGVTFTGSGVLPASPNPQSVTLFASGTPSAEGQYTYTLTGSGVTSTCTFMQTYSAAPLPPNGSITAFINGSTTAATFNTGADGLYTVQMGVASLNIGGDSTAASNSAKLLLSCFNTGGTINPGSNYNSTSHTNLGVIQYDASNGNSYIASINGGTLSITITSITTTAPLRVKGTFTAVCKDNGGAGPNSVTFTGGAFDVPYQ